MASAADTAQRCDPEVTRDVQREPFGFGVALVGRQHVDRQRDAWQRRSSPSARTAAAKLATWPNCQILHEKDDYPINAAAEKLIC
ncbi:hypothetical protein [Burkholderia multivorans]|jgi:hypothetical protein|uniref:hypothetical protein n=1 Tax=Burkholderia multivorans TaxID=87883 RepID=UPI0011B1DCD4|nr:hypothetical protein [Burkholderia multivorans]MBY4791629.1 hypothetical protein [Burkholderia multivorans]